MKRFKDYMHAAPLSQEQWEEAVFGVEISEVLKQVDGKWALVSKKTGKPLAYYDGEGKPSDEWVAKQERRIQFFKHKG